MSYKIRKKHLVGASIFTVCVAIVFGIGSCIADEERRAEREARIQEQKAEREARIQEREENRSGSTFIDTHALDNVPVRAIRYKYTYQNGRQTITYSRRKGIESLGDCFRFASERAILRGRDGNVSVEFSCRADDLYVTATAIDRQDMFYGVNVRLNRTGHELNFGQ